MKDAARSDGEYFGAFAEARLASDVGAEWSRHDEAFDSPEAVRSFVRGLEPSSGPVFVYVTTEGGRTADRAAVGGLWLIDDSPRRTTHLPNSANNAMNSVEWWEWANGPRLMQMAASVGVHRRHLLAAASAAAKATMRLLPGLDSRVAPLLAPVDEAAAGSKKKSVRSDAAANARALAEIFSANPHLTGPGSDAEAFAMYATRHALLAAAAEGDEAEREAKEAVSLADRAVQIDLRSSRSKKAKDEVAEAIRRAVPTVVFVRALAGVRR